MQTLNLPAAALCEGPAGSAPEVIRADDGVAGGSKVPGSAAVSLGAAAQGVCAAVAPATGAAATAPPRELGGPVGPEPTRYGDWERKGRCVDF